MPAIRTDALRRTYRSRDKHTTVVALEGLSLEIAEGEVFGLLGPNGAGKTTLVKVLSTVLLPTSGSAAVLGHDVVKEVRAVRRLIGIVLGGDRGLYPWISGIDNLNYWAALYDVPRPVARARIAALLERVGLSERARDPVETYSRGMKQRLHLARGLVSGAKVLFLDEPTMGMDPLAARDFRTLVHELKDEGTTILLTTHDMAEAEAVCDRVALIDHGRLIATETPQTLASLVAGHERITFRGAPAETIALVGSMAAVAAVDELADGAYRAVMADSRATSEVISILAHAGVASINTSPPSLEEVYVHILGERGLRL
ncbi:MAG TPA: ABC transporter ATP-binding protein [Dehalococcoidia bacterium]|nr:ABC transporter ATP-binding protein [Dehalococcoidia bacterium]